MVNFTETEVLITMDEINDLEKYVGLTFPDQYKKHLLKYNGGRCSPNIFSFYQNGRKNESDVDWFLAIYDGKYDNLKEHIKTMKLEEKRMPSFMLPIAHDSGGNLICISCDTEDEGYIYFWDHENEVDYNTSDDSDYSNLFFVAKSFNEFINGLKKDFG